MLSKNYNPQKQEKGIYENQEKSGLFSPKEKGEKNYCIVMPPPNVTGILHMGHATMLALEDILVRFHRMKGYRTLWVPGTDHAAIATQTKVEKLLKEKGLTRHQLGREKFLKEVDDFAKKSHDGIVRQIKKMGASCDWTREAFTLDKTRTRAVRTVFKMMYDDGLIYRGERVVNWCPRCHSTLADDEVEYKQQKTKLYTFRYSKDFPFSISTTRPETKLGDTAVAVNPQDERYKKYIGKVFEVDFLGVSLKLKIIADRGVEMGFGTGALGVTPAHSLVDWEMAQNNDLEIKKIIDEDGKIKEGLGEFSGLSAEEARSRVVKRLKEKGLLEKEEDIDNNLSLCYRCDTPIEPLPSRQWFIDVNKKIPRLGKSIKELATEAVEKGVFGRPPIRIFPERFKKDYFYWMENLRDWCISRQIWYGHRVPVWYCRGEDKGCCQVDCSKPIVSIETPQECPVCGSKDLVQDEDTLDTWFSSGLWTFSVLAQKPEQIKLESGKLVIDSQDFRDFHPTQVLETGRDILFFWVARMIIMTTYALEDIPFFDVYLHGLVLDGEGKKMSKSKGNVIDPLEMAEKYGTDATRLSLVVGTAPGNDFRISEEKIQSFQKFVNKLWNIARFIITNSSYLSRNFAFSQEDLTLADRWILGKMRRLIEEIEEGLKKYDFSLVAEKLREFTWDDLADWYLEISKFEKNAGKEKVLRKILEDLLKLWHPFIPFVTESIWQELGKDKFIMEEEWPKVDDYKVDKGDDFELVKDIIGSIRSARAENKVEPTRKVKAVIYADNKTELLRGQETLIKNLRTGIEELEIKETGEKIKKAIYITEGKTEIYLLGAVDPEKEKKRLTKEKEKLEKIIKNIENKLNNKEFIKKAPREIVERERGRLENFKTELERVREKLKEL